MKVAMLNTYDIIGGAARAAYRLHRGLIHAGVESNMFVQNKLTDDRTVVGPHSLADKTASLLNHYLERIPLRLYPNRDRYIYSTAISFSRVARKIKKNNPDVIHLHWIADGFICIETFKRFGKPLLWTLHDSWAFTGGCHLPNQCTKYYARCGMCPALGSRAQIDLSYWVWRRKQKNWKKLSLTIVTPSRWLANCAKESSLLRNTRVKVIPNGLDVARFKPVDKKMARELFALPKDKKLLLFGAIGSLSDKNKGLHLLLPALNQLSPAYNKEVELIVFGERRPIDGPDFGFKTHYIGKLYDEESISLLYSAADIFVAPSLQENLPNMVMEAMACGTPCVAFHIGGLPDLIGHEHCGYLAKPYEVNDLARGISYLLDNDQRRLQFSHRSRSKVETEFALETIVTQYICLYEEMLTS